MAQQRIDIGAKAAELAAAILKNSPDAHKLAAELAYMLRPP